MTYSIIKKSQLEGALRLDAECYHKDKIEALKALNKLRGNKISDYFYSSRKVFNPFSQKINEKTTIYDLSNAKGLFLSNGKTFDNEKEIGSIKKIIANNDVIISRLRSYLKEIAFVFGDTKEEKLASTEFIVLRQKNNKVLPELIFSFLQSNVIQKILEWSQEGVNHPRFSEDVLLSIRLPNILINNQSKIKRLVNNAYDQYNETKKFYHQAEEILLEELGLKDFENENDLVSIVKLSEVKNANRIDAEYFQAKYKKLVENIKKQNVKKLEELVNNYSTGYPFKSENYLDNGIPLIRINNIKKDGVDLSDTAYLSEKDNNLSPKDTAIAGDIVLSMSGSIGLTAKIPVDIPKCSINQRILKFTPKNIETDFLVLVLNSIVGKLQLERIGTGGVQTNISYKDIKNILIPILPKSTQQKIAELVRKSHEARQKSKELLEEAKHKVEELIEKT